jgi:integrative and conjugative element protein (TIGR02256 family)
MPPLWPRRLAAAALAAAGSVWLSRKNFLEMTDEADRWAPLETGGILLGYHRPDARAFVLTHVVGPGPEAVHERTGFVPDQEYHLHEIARLYAASGRRLQYLGDWHCHPGGAAALSRTDHSTLKRIAAEPAARAARPLMCVLAPGPRWDVAVWQGELRHRRRCWSRQQLALHRLDVLLFDEPRAVELSR